MDKLAFMIAAILASWLIQVPQSAEGEMLTLTDEELGIQFFQGMTETPTAVRAENHIKTQTEQLLEETEEKKLENYIRERSTPKIKQELDVVPTKVVYVVKWVTVGCSSGSGGASTCSTR
jgi:hypothetical protein